VLTLAFSREVIIPTNYQSISEKDLIILIIPGGDSNLEKLGFTWEVISFTSTSM